MLTHFHRPCREWSGTTKLGGPQSRSRPANWNAPASLPRARSLVLKDRTGPLSRNREPIHSGRSGRFAKLGASSDELLSEIGGTKKFLISTEMN